MKSSEKGNKGLSLAIGYFGSNGYTVAIPLTDTQDYDLIVDDGVLHKVQVKYVEHKNKAGNYDVGLRVMSGTSRKPAKMANECIYDLLFIVCGNGKMYVIPKDAIKNMNSIALYSDYDKYIVG